MIQTADIVGVAYKRRVSILDLRDTGELLSSEILDEDILKVMWFGEARTSLLVMTATNLFEFSLISTNNNRMVRIAESGINMYNDSDNSLWSFSNKCIQHISFNNTDKQYKIERRIEFSEDYRKPSVIPYDGCTFIVYCTDTCTRIRNLESLVYKPSENLITVFEEVSTLVKGSMTSFRISDTITEKSSVSDLVKQRLISVLSTCEGSLFKTSDTLFLSAITNIKRESSQSRVVEVPSELLETDILKKDMNDLNEETKSRILKSCSSFISLILVSKLFDCYEILLERVRNEGNDSDLILLYCMLYFKGSQSCLKMLDSVFSSISENSTKSESCREVVNAHLLRNKQFTEFVSKNKGSVSLTDYRRFVDVADLDIQEVSEVRNLFYGINNSNINKGTSSRNVASNKNVAGTEKQPAKVNPSTNSANSVSNIPRPTVPQSPVKGMNINKSKTIGKMPMSPKPVLNTMKTPQMNSSSNMMNNSSNKSKPLSPPMKGKSVSQIPRPVSPKPKQPSIPTSVTNTASINRPNNLRNSYNNIRGNTNLNRRIETNTPQKSAYMPPLEKPSLNIYKIPESEIEYLNNQMNYVSNIAEIIKESGSLIQKSKARNVLKKCKIYHTFIEKVNDGGVKISESAVSRIKDIFAVCEFESVTDFVNNNIDDPENEYKNKLRERVPIVKDMVREVCDKYSGSEIETWLGSLVEVLVCSAGSKK